MAHDNVELFQKLHCDLMELVHALECSSRYPQTTAKPIPDDCELVTVRLSDGRVKQIMVVKDKMVCKTSLKTHPSFKKLIQTEKRIQETLKHREMQRLCFLDADKKRKKQKLEYQKASEQRMICAWVLKEYSKPLQVDNPWKYVGVEMAHNHLWAMEKAVTEANSEENLYKDIEPILPVDDLDSIIDDIDECLYDKQIHFYSDGFSEFVYF